MSVQTLTTDAAVYKNIEASEEQTIPAVKLKHKRCLIINPGDLALELLKEPFFIERYSTDLWDENSENDLISSLIANEYDTILLDTSSTSILDKDALRFINNLRVNHVSIYNLASFYESLVKRVPIQHYSEISLINSNIFFVNKRKKYIVFKRAFDFAVSLSIAPFALVLVLIAILGIKLTSKGPAFFVQRRVGLRGEIFNIYKLRTMSHSIEDTNRAHTVANDSRVTPLGKILRKTKIDELPQLHNILNGDMSLIGPRPEREEIVSKLVNHDPYYNLRHSIRPGVTGWAQVNNPTATPEQSLEKLEYDLYYVKNASSSLDFKILLKTIKVVFTLDSL